MTRARIRSRLGIPAGLALGLSLAITVPWSTAAAAPDLIIVGSSCIHGELTSCGCAKRDLGGFAHKATLIKQERAAGPVLLVDAGDFAPDRGFERHNKTAFIYELMARLDYDAVTPGEREMMDGLEPLREICAAHPELKMVSANVMDKSGNLIWPEYTIVERGGRKIGVTGITGNAFYKFNVMRKAQVSDDFTFQDPATALRRVVGELQGRVDLVVALLHQPEDEAKKLLTAVPGVDVAVLGHNSKYVFDAEHAGGALVLSPGTRGQYLSVLSLSFGPDGKILSSAAEGKPVTQDLAKDPVLEPLVTKWETAWKAREKAQDKGKKDEGTE